MLIALFAIFSAIVWGAESGDDVLAETSQIKLTRADYEAALTRIPADARDEFASSPRRLTLFLNNLVISKTLAAQAQQAGLSPDPDQRSKARQSTHTGSEPAPRNDLSLS